MKLKTRNPIVEMDGDEMTRVMWKMVKDKLLVPHIDMDLEYYDLHVKHRDDTDDRVTVDAANAIKKHRVGVKCATITPNADRVDEYKLKKAWKSPNGTIRAILDGTVFRKPILAANIKPFVSTWKKPISIGRHAYGDIYSGSELRVPGPGTAEMVFTPAGSGKALSRKIADFSGPGVIMGMHNTDESIAGFANSCFQYALDEKIDVWFSTKDTVSKTYDAHFRKVFDDEFARDWKEKFDRAGLTYFFTLIDDAAARIIRSEGGFLWALKNYDGDVMSDLIASGSGSLAMMTSVLVSPHGYYEYEAAHGTVQKHYYNYLKGIPTSTNSMALIFAWSGALRKRGELDGTPEIVDFAGKLERAALQTVEKGIMTGDLLQVATPAPGNRKAGTEEFIDAIAAELERKLKD